LNIVDVLLEVSDLDRTVNATFRELVSISHDIVVDIVLENGLDQSNIFVVGDSTSIVDLRTKEVDDLVWNDIVFIQKHFELFLAHCQILICKLIGNVPAYRAEFPTILDNSVE
jgi:hypothetical protein